MTTNTTDLKTTLDLSIAEITRRTQAGDVSAREITEAHIRRIEATRAALNHVVFPTFDDARRMADKLDARQQAGEQPGALHGVPVTIKESFDVAGTPTTNGLTNRRDHIADEDAPIVARLRRAGAVILGKTNLPQLCMMTETDNPVYGRTNNPWNLERAPGGSSGGCAAAIATGGAVLSLGSDIGGSVRIPAHHCGVHALKPTNDRFTMRGHALVTPGQRAIVAQPGIIARHVRDIELAMRVLCDETGAPNLSPAANGSPLVPAPPAFRPSAYDADSPPDLRGLRIAVCTDDNFFTASPAIRRATREAALAAREAGAEIADWTPPDVGEAMRLYFGLVLGDGMRPARELLRGSRKDWRIRLITSVAALPHSLLSVFAKPYELFGQHHAAHSARSIGRRSIASYLQLVEARDVYTENFLAAFDREGFDALIYPPFALPALRHGASLYLANALSYTALFNLLGLPAGVVAATRIEPGMETSRAASRDLVERYALETEEGSAGLPVGVQVVARHWREDIVLRVMSTLEKHFRARPRYPHAPPI